MTEDQRPERSSDDLIREAPEERRTHEPLPTEQPPGDTAAPPYAAPDESAPAVTPSDPIGESEPPPLEKPAPAQPVEPAPTPSPAAAGARTWLIVTAVLVVGVGVLIVLALRSDSTSIASIGAGDCFQDPGLGEISAFETADCDDPHDFESIGRITLPAGPYPGDDEVILAAVEECLTLFEPYVGTPFNESALFVDAFVPTRDSWEADDRDAICIVFEAADEFDPIPLTGSVRNSG